MAGSKTALIRLLFLTVVSRGRQAQHCASSNTPHLDQQPLPPRAKFKGIASNMDENATNRTLTGTRIFTHRNPAHPAGLSEH
jgi:hypothetical protein